MIQNFKERHGELHKWLIQNNIDFTNLQQYSASIVATFVLALNTKYPVKAVPTDSVDFYKPVTAIERQELANLDEDEKARLVWDRYGHVIKRKSAQYNLDPKLVFATVMVESKGDTYAIRYEPQIGDASYGLGQILYGTAVSIGFEGNPDQLYDPEVNIDLISRYHRRNLEVYGNLTNEQLITAYNTGNPYSYALPGHLDKFSKWFNKANYLSV